MSEQEIDTSNQSKIMEYRQEIDQFLHILISSTQDQKQISLEHEPASCQNQKIPFLPIELKTDEINRIWPNIGDLFFNLEGGILLFLTDSQMVPEETYFLNLNENGNISQIKKVLLSDIPVQIQGNVNIEDQFDQLKSWIKTQFNSELGNLLLISNQLINDLISIYISSTQNSKSTDLIELVANYISKFAQSQVQKNLIIYPLPRFFHFINSLTKIMKNIQLNEIIQQIKQLLPNLQATFSFQIDQNFIPLKIIVENGIMSLTRIEFNTEDLKDLEPVVFRKKWLKKLQKQEGMTQNIILNLKEFHQIISDVMESEFPLSPSRFKFLLQKILFFYKSRGELWDLEPWPLIYYPAFRFIAYNLGFRINLYKISHWSIPETLEIFSSKAFGMNSRIVICIGDENIFQQKTEASTDSNPQLYSIQVENRTLTTIEEIPRSHFASFLENYANPLPNLVSGQKAKKNEKIDQNGPLKQILEDFREYLCQNLSYTNSIIYLKKFFISTLLQEMNVELFGRRFPPMLKSKKILQKSLQEGGLCIVPQNKYIEQAQFKNFDEIIKILVALGIDQREY